MSSVTLPLHGKTVLITRSVHDAPLFSERLQRLGAQVCVVPSIDFKLIQPISEDVRDAVEALPSASWIGFASRHAVRFFGELLGILHVPWPTHVRWAALGTGTASELEMRGHRVDGVAKVATAEGLAQVLCEKACPRAGWMALPSASCGRTLAYERLRAAGYAVRRMVIYETCPAQPLGAHVVQAWPSKVDYVVFTSPSTVQGFLAQSPLPAGAQVVSIGPTTSCALRAQGVSVAREAQPHTLEGLIEALY